MLVAARENPDEHWLDLWRGVPGSSVRHFPLPSDWLDGGRGDAQLTPDGEFMVAGTSEKGVKTFVVSPESLCDMYIYIYIYHD